MNHASLTVKGMSCSHCVNAIETHVGKLNGVSSVKVSLGEGKVEVDFNPDAVTLKQIIETIEDQGYDVEG
ncbi:copper chaperone CopZ [Lihuaxuella thermophila]|uniref:Copper chaperone CopZ n=1 Tax=Lihuaxuella thermophila TaxID=1173111 RepID=A0A1H8JBB6_9BACL|nr:copper chaperone CopZ [Lihuaxuella thermophila]SEN77705.1 copper chaperone [Lihuaxuella thermophila]